MCKKGIGVLFAAVLLVGLAACSKNDSVKDTDYKNYVFKEVSAIEMPQDSNIYMEEMGTDGSKVYMAFVETIYEEGDFTGEIYDGTDQDDILIQPKGTPAEESSSEESVQNEEIEEISEDEETDSSAEWEGEEVYPEYDDSVEYAFYTNVYLKKYDLQGTKTDEVTIRLEDGVSIGSLVVMPEKQCIYMATFDAKQEWNICIYGMDGVLQNQKEMDTGSEVYGFYVGAMVVADDGSLIIANDRTISIYAPDLSSKKVVENSEYIYSIEKAGDGSIYAFLEQDNEENIECIIHKIDLNEGKLTETKNIPQNFFYSNLNPGVGVYDFIINQEDGLYGYQFTDNSLKKIMGFIESDVYSQYTQEGLLVNETTALIPYVDPETWCMTDILVYEKVAPEEVTDKEILTLGMLYYDQSVAGMVIDYNKKSETSKILIKQYMQNSLEWEDVKKAYHNDLITGNCPDIVVMSGDMEEYYTYIDKGIFASLDEYMETDAEVKKDDIFPNIKSALSKNDKMYAVTPNFYVTTLGMKSKYVQENGRISFKELQELEGRLNTKAFHEMDREQLIYQMISMGYRDFMDIRTGKCNFSASFTQALEYIAQYPEIVEYEEITDYSYYDTIYRNDVALLSYVYLTDFSGFNRMEKGVFGEEITLVGFPGEEGTGAALNIEYLLSISAKSKYKEEAWSFIRQFMLNDYIKEHNYYFPGRISLCEEFMEEAMSPYYTDEFGNEVEKNDLYWIGDNEIELEPISKERAAYVMEYIKTVDTVIYGNYKVSDMIKEEAAPFFEGQKTAEQATDIIQSRVQTYINEGR